MTSYYDHVLGLIPVAFTAVAAVLTLAGYSTAVAIPVAGGVGVALVGHALFVAGPVDEHVGVVGQSARSPQSNPSASDDAAPMPAAD